MEVVSRDLKALGLYQARALSFGDKTSALETLGEKQVELPKGGGPARDFHPKIPDHLRSSDDKLTPLPNVNRDSLRAVPQIDLPERNIERSR